MTLPCNTSDIQTAVFSKPASGAGYDRLKIRQNTEGAFLEEAFSKTQAFHKKLTALQLEDFLKTAEKDWHAITIETQDKTYTVLTSRKGKTTLLTKARKQAPAAATASSPAVNLTRAPHNRVKQYILPEGEPVPFLVQLGVMTADGRVHAQKYDKYRQINRFLEFVRDLMEPLTATHEETAPGKPFRVIDFGCGKSYLTFALYHYLSVQCGLPAEVFGLDLKQTVIQDCSRLAETCGYTGLHFACGDIAEYRREQASGPAAQAPDLVMTLHACDTATDYALAYAVEHGAHAILSVPCCQHELNTALGSTAPDAALDPLLKYGIVKERFAALATDTLRAELLTAAGYRTQLLEFIDMEHTPKNILIRAIRKNPTPAADTARNDGQPQHPLLTEQAERLKAALGVELTLEKLLKGT